MRHPSTLRGSIVLAVITVTAALGATDVPAHAAKCRDQTPTGASIRLTPDQEPGEPLVIEGRVLDGDGRPIAGASVYAYQADARGFYVPNVRVGFGQSNPRLCGVLRTDSTGRYRITTVRPSSVQNIEGGAPHVHFEIWDAKSGRPITSLLTFTPLRNVARREAAARVAEGARTTVDRPIARDTDGVWRCVRDFRLR